MPLTPSETRALLEQLGHRPIRKLGQNFLIDGNIVRKSLELARVQSADTVVEIGPGLGTLTRALLAKGTQVFAVEYDPRLHAWLDGDFRATVGAQASARFHLIHADALDQPLAGLNEEASTQHAEISALKGTDSPPPEGSPASGHAAFRAPRSSFKIVANLPYAISTPWLDAVLGGALPQCMTLMLQKEAADRFTAEPGGKNYGAIAIFLQSAFRRADSHRVSRNCFYPVPDVDSILLHLERQPEPFIFAEDKKQTIRRLFTQRRKQLGALCKGDPQLLAWLQRENINPTQRADTVALAQWQRL